VAAGHADVDEVGRVVGRAVAFGVAADRRRRALTVPALALAAVREDAIDVDEPFEAIDLAAHAGRGPVGEALGDHVRARLDARRGARAAVQAVDVAALAVAELLVGRA